MVRFRMEDIDSILEPLRLSVKEQGDIVRELKAQKAPELDIKTAVAELKKRKKALQDKENELVAAEAPFDRVQFEACLKKRFFFGQAFEIYGGVAGLFDYGPVGCMLKNNVIDLWRRHFITNDDMLEVECTMMTPSKVLEASGHAQRFADLMVKDLTNGDCFRADHLLEAAIEKALTDKTTSEELKADMRATSPLIEGFSKEELGAKLSQYKVKSPSSGGDISEPMEFNLMFRSEIGPTGAQPAFLRPETAQGIFLNFKRLLDFNNGKLPFAGAQIGHSFRNEIAPRAGLIRCREFQMAEIEHFYDPADASHSSLESVKELILPFFTKDAQMGGGKLTKCSIGEALKNGVLCNETLAYFIGRIFLFAKAIGIDPARMRFRQHMDNEMAHYAKDCWDLECRTSYGWVECVGCADRSCFDLQCHAEASKVNLQAERTLPQPIEKEVFEAIPVKKFIAKQFKKDTPAVTEAIVSADAADLEKQFENSEKITLAGFEISKEMIQLKKSVKKFHTESFTPCGEEVFTIPPLVAPYKCSVLPLSNKPEFDPFINTISSGLKSLSVAHKVDKSSGSIGKRYARTDEIAVPFGVTVDFHTVKITPATVTLRDRDTLDQIRVPVQDTANLINEMASQRQSWAQVAARYPSQDDWLKENPLE
ncbi:Oidioi.mRNA.OKI2018_I69.chr2.g4471.t1.cds [Oikopleura dioica]|uniref:Glycine--tRNA ligase n=1 Tax=Oikopleura dioica TaxID=34765 RepID=A0ABN7SXV5_OIKDI|nr:Oidioi.mRNA.OKI2018_I69.chr2.g4471.t1.cds [Oikopleura dioica]